MSADVIQLSRHGTIPMKNDRSRLQVTTTEAMELTKHESINHDGYGSTLKLVRRNVWGQKGVINCFKSCFKGGDTGPQVSPHWCKYLFRHGGRKIC